MIGVAISILPISKYRLENVTLARPRVLSLPCVGITREFLRRNLNESVQGGVRCDNDVIIEVIMPAYSRVIVNPHLTLLFFSFCTTICFRIRSSWGQAPDLLKHILASEELESKWAGGRDFMW